jgi:hypothetical protein
MNTPRFLFIAFALGSLLGSVRADFSINTEYANLFQSDGVTQIGAGVVGILVADEGTTAGIVDPVNTVLSVGNYLGGTSDDRIIGTFTSISSVAGQGNGFQKDFTALTYSGNFNAGDKLYLLWFPTITTVGATVGAGQTYGSYRTDAVDVASGANIAWIAPSDGGTYNMSAYLDSIYSGSGVTAADFTASQVTAVPEPSIYGLVGVGAVGLILFRARNRRRG